MPAPVDPNRPAQANRFLVTAVEAAEAEGFIAVTLLDGRGGSVTLHLDETCGKLLRDLLDEQLP